MVSVFILIIPLWINYLIVQVQCKKHFQNYPGDIATCEYGTIGH